MTANAADNVGVAGVQFRLDGANLGTEDTTAPVLGAVGHARRCPTATHTLTAVARDAAGNTHDRRRRSRSRSTTRRSTRAASSPRTASRSRAAPPSPTRSSQANARHAAAAPRARRPGASAARSSFDGAGDWVTCPTRTRSTSRPAMTLEAWVNPTATGGWRTAVIKERHRRPRPTALYANSSTNRPSAHVHIGASELDTRGTAQLPLNTWSHLAATYDGANLRLYVNGTLVGDAADHRRARGRHRPAADRRQRVRWGEYFAGLIDEVRVYNRALTAGRDPGRHEHADRLASDASAADRAHRPDRDRRHRPGVAELDGRRRRHRRRRATTSTAARPAGFTPSAGQPRRPADRHELRRHRRCAAGTWFYKVTAAGRRRQRRPRVQRGQRGRHGRHDARRPCRSPRPAAGATVRRHGDLTANAADNVAVAGVQFRVDGDQRSAPRTPRAPYSVTWDTLTVTERQPHTITAVATRRATTRPRPRRHGHREQPAGRHHRPRRRLRLRGGHRRHRRPTRRAPGNDGTITGATLDRPAGKFGNALSFDGVNDRGHRRRTSASLDLSTAHDARGVGPAPTQHAGWRTVLMKEAARRPGLRACTRARGTDRPSGHVNTTARARHARHRPRCPSARGPTWPRPTTAPTLRLYVNGAQVSSRAVTGGTIAASTGAAAHRRQRDLGRVLRAASIDEVRVYRRALSAAEITTDMDTPVAAARRPRRARDDRASSPPPIDVAAGARPHRHALQRQGRGLGRLRRRAQLRAGLGPGDRHVRPGARAAATCSAPGHVTLPDGRLFIAGGHIAANEGTKDTHIFNPTTRTWFRGTDMARGALVPDRHDAARRPHPRRLRRQHHAQRARASRRRCKNGVGDAARDLQRRHEHVDAADRRPSAACRCTRSCSCCPTAASFDAGPDLQTRTLDTTTGQWTNVGHQPDRRPQRGHVPAGQDPQVGHVGRSRLPGHRLATNRAATIDFNGASPRGSDSGADAPRPLVPHAHRRCPTAPCSPPAAAARPTASTTSQGRARRPRSGTRTPTSGRETAVAPAAAPVPLVRAAAAGRPRAAGRRRRVRLRARTRATPRSSRRPTCSRAPRPTITSAPAIVQPRPELHRQHAGRRAASRRWRSMRMGSVTHNFDMDQRFMNLLRSRRPAPGHAQRRRADQPQRRAPRLLLPVRRQRQRRARRSARSSQVEPPPATRRRRPPSQPGRHGDGERRRRHAQLDRRDRQRRRHRVPRAPLHDRRLHAVGRQPDRHRDGPAPTYTDASLAPGTYYYGWSPPTRPATPAPSSREESGHRAGDTTPPTVSITAPAAGATVAAPTCRDRQRGRQPRRDVASSSGSTAPTSAARTRRRRTA